MICSKFTSYCCCFDTHFERRLQPIIFTNCFVSHSHFKLNVEREIILTTDENLLIIVAFLCTHIKCRHLTSHPKNKNDAKYYSSHFSAAHNNRTNPTNISSQHELSSLVITLKKGWLGRVSVAFKLTFYVHNNSHVVQRALQLHISILINYKQNNSKATHILVMMVRRRESEGVNKKRKIKRNKISFEHERINLWNRICFTLLFFCCCLSYAQRNETLKQKKNFF